MASMIGIETTVESNGAAGDKRVFGARSLTWSGLVLIYAAVGAFAAVAYYSWTLRTFARPHFYQYTPELLGCGVGIFAALLGVKLIRAGGTSPSDPLPVVNPKEWQILAGAMNNREDPIGEYIRLSSLTGATGFFRKLDLAGLPLATIALTIFFAVGSLMFPDRKFYELTQLTLGAFIGSFVQKQVGALREAKQAASDAQKDAAKTDNDGGTRDKTGEGKSAGKGDVA
jgi:hypothetical protein